MPRLMSISSPIRNSLPLYLSFQNTGVASGGREGNWVDVSSYMRISEVIMLRRMSGTSCFI